MAPGFGINVNWDWDKNEIPTGHSLPFIRALSIAIEGMVIRLALPRLFLSLTKQGREALCGYYELEVGHSRTLYQ